MKVGMPVNLQFNEPWDLVTHIGSGCFRGTISQIALDSDCALISLDEPVGYAGQSAVQLIAMPRFEGQSIMTGPEGLICGFIAVDHLLAARFTELEPRKLTSWLQAIGTLKATNP